MEWYGTVWHGYGMVGQVGSAKGHPLAARGPSGGAPRGAQHWSGAQGGPCNQLVLGVAPKVFPAAGPGAW